MNTDRPSTSVYSDLRGVTFEYCELLKNEWNGLYLAKCITGSTLGVFSGYIFPIFSIIALITNSIFIYVFFKDKPSMPRHMIYMICISISGTLTDISVGWLWLFPSRGLPYTTKGSIYFSPFLLSPASCRLHRLFHSFTSTSIINLLVLAAVDRCLAISIPVKFSKLPPHYAWYACGVVWLFSFFMMLPFIFFVQWNDKKDGFHCWVSLAHQFFHVYHTLFSNFGPIQTVILLFLNLTFLLFTRKYLQNRIVQECTRRMNRKEVRICLLMLILSTFYIAISIPQAICLLLARMAVNLSKIHKMIAYDIAHLMWSLNAVREIADFIVYAIYFKPLKYLLTNWCLTVKSLYKRILRYIKC
ncbi:unnamed protein product [Heterobilharzia americana]|nr:unnamed protein product [Heterobilharzia americana]